MKTNRLGVTTNTLSSCYRPFLPPYRRLGHAMQTTNGLGSASLTNGCLAQKTKNMVLDQGSQFTSIDWAAFVKHHNLKHPLSAILYIACRVKMSPCRELFQPAQTRADQAKNLLNPPTSKV